MKSLLRSYSPDKLTERLILDFYVNSPIHIGSGHGRLSPQEFVFSNGHTHLIDEGRLSLFLKEKELIDPFVREVGNRSFSIEKFLSDQTKMPFKDFVGDISSITVPGGAESMREFRPFIRDGNKEIFLPGSSLKGVLRTALLYGILEENQEIRHKTEKTAQEKLSLLPRYKETFSERWVREDLLQSFNIAKGKTGPNKDILRCLKVRDAYPAGNIRTRIIRISFLSKSSSKGFDWSYRKRGGKSTDQPLELWAEVVTGGTFRAELIWDKLLFEKFKRADSDIRIPIEGLNDLMSAAFKMNQRIFAHETEFFSEIPGEPGKGTVSGGKNDLPADAAENLKNWYEMSPGDFIRVGFGSGMLSTTVNIHFNEPLRRKIRDLCGHKREDDPAPKSRRIWQGDYGQWMPLGWLKMTPGAEHDADGMKNGDESVSHPSDAERLTEELSRIRSNDMGRIGTIIQKIDSLETDAEKKAIAMAIQEKVGPRAFKKLKKMGYLLELIAK